MKTIVFAAQILFCFVLLLFQLLTMAAAAPSITGVFDHGSYGVALVKVDEAPRKCSAARKSAAPTGGGGAGAPPKPLLVAAPREAGEYPVVLFLHGYLANNSFYSQLLEHVASHGFVVVGPQLYAISGPGTTDEINSAAAVINWLAAGGLSSKLPPDVRADSTKVSISGHSRGGKVAFALALGHANVSLPPIAALVAVDPVDGMGAGKQTPPPILTYKENSLRVAAPVMVVGTGLGGLPRGPLLPPCAPRGVSHDDFYGECAAPTACHLVARDYGHTDMMDDVTPGARGLATRAVCRSGGARAPMRRFVGGAMVAFLKRWVGGEPGLLDGIRARPETAPVALSVVEFRDGGDDDDRNS
ncbi:chlorophyllase-2 [Oryza brachyantha]|uniref:chlorophyllase-2 n=1 Tax=Oryza brachyantha TaxID=4533 RepID=UPI001ADC809F|nr:chlorophyllase-2 [Oryza brachyantha]